MNLSQILMKIIFVLQLTVLLLACRLLERITAVGMVAGAFHSPCEQPAQPRPVPAIFFHGEQDRIVPIISGEYPRTA